MVYNYETFLYELDHDTVYGMGGYKEMYFKKFTYTVMDLVINHKGNQISTAACMYYICITATSRMPKCTNVHRYFL